jgi:hypothetical protein
MSLRRCQKITGLVIMIVALAMHGHTAPRPAGHFLGHNWKPVERWRPIDTLGCGSTGGLSMCYRVVSNV